MQRGLLVASCLAGLLLPSCALHLVAPEPDIRTLQPVEPAPETSFIAAVARLPLMQVAELVERYALTPIQRQGTTGLAQWKLDVTRTGIVTPRAENGSLCLLVPFRVVAHVQAFGAGLDKALDIAVDVCARPELQQSGELKFQTPVVRVNAPGLNLPGPLSMLSAEIVTALQDYAGRQLSGFIAQVRVPVSATVGPMTTALNRPMVLPQDACLKLRPQDIRTSQPDVDPSALRLAVVVAALPTVEQPCVAPTETQPPAQVPIHVMRELGVPETRLLLPIGMSLENVQEQARRQLITGKPLPLGEGKGWVQFDSVRLDSAKGALLIRVKLHGELADKFLFIPFHRALDGEFILWGVPEVTETEVRLTDVHLDLQTDDRLVALGVALKQADLVAQVADKVRIPRLTIETQARDAVLGLARPLDVQGQRLPVRVDVKQLTIERVRTVGQRLEVMVRFVGQILLGATDRI